MKYKILLFLLMCCTLLQAQRKPNIKGNRSVVEVQKELPAFNKIELRDELEIILSPAPIPGYDIQADDNLIDILKFEVEDNTLRISSFYNIRSRKELRIVIRYTELNSLVLHSGKVLTEEIHTAEMLKIHAMGDSRMELKTGAAYTEVLMEDSSSGDLQVNSDSLRLNLKGKTDLKVYTSGNNTALDMEEDADALLEGTAERLQVSLMGNASLKAERFEAGEVKAQLQGSSTARIHALNSLELSSRNSGRTYLYGTPAIQIQEFLDSSELYKRKE